MDVCIKNIDPDTWHEFKVEAVENGMTMGEYFSEVNGKKKKAKGNLKEVLYGPKPLAEELKKIDFKKIRKIFDRALTMREFK